MLLEKKFTIVLLVMWFSIPCFAVKKSRKPDVFAGLLSPARLTNLASLKLVPQPLRKAVTVFEMQGARPTAEDALLIRIRGDWLAFALFDGHGGSLVSKALVRPSSSTNLLDKLLDHVCRDGKLIQKLVNKIYRAIDDRFALIKGGSTAIVCLINRVSGRVYFLNLGDSRAVAIRGYGKIGATKDHKPDGVGEEARIKGEGGFVTLGRCARVDGRIAVSRAFGDFHCKPWSNVDERRHYHMGIIPDIYTFNLKDIETIILACDGVWDVVENNEVVAILSDANRLGYDPAEFLCKKACQLGSGDNISAQVINVAALPAFVKPPSLVGHGADAAKLGRNTVYSVCPTAVQ